MTLLLLALLAQAPAPQGGLTLSFAMKVPFDRQLSTLGELERELNAGGLKTRRVQTQCSGEPKCLAAACRVEQVQVLIGVTLAAIGKDVGVDLESFIPTRETAVAHLTLALKGGRLSAQDRTEVAKFARETIALLPANDPFSRAEAPPPKTDAPKLEAPPSLLPETGAREEFVAAPLEPKKLPWAPIALGIGALAAAGTSATFGVLGAQSRQQLYETPDGVRSVHTREQALALQKTAQTQLTVSLVAGIAAGALATAAIVWWLAD